MKTKNYKKVYYFNVLDELKNGETVYVIDKEDKTISKVNTMVAEDLITLLDYPHDDDRFEFYKIIETEIKQNV